MAKENKPVIKKRRALPYEQWLEELLSFLPRKDLPLLSPVTDGGATVEDLLKAWHSCGIRPERGARLFTLRYALEIKTLQEEKELKREGVS